MAPRPHVAHHHDPAQTLVQKIAHRLVIGHGLYGVGQEPHLVALLGDQAADQQIIGGTILDCLVATESARRSRRVAIVGPSANFTPSNCHAPEFPRKNRKAYRSPASVAPGSSRRWEGRNRLPPLPSDQQRRHDHVQVVGVSTDVAVVDDQNFMLRLAGQPRQLRHFVVGGVATRTIKHSIRRSGKSRLIFSMTGRTGSVSSPTQNRISYSG